MLTWQYPWGHLQYFAPEADGGGGGSGGGTGGGTGDGTGGGTAGAGAAGAGGQAAGAGTGDADGKPPITYEAWYGALPDAQKALVTTHIGGLTTALSSERDQRKDLGKQLRAATGKLDEGSETRKELEAMTSKLELAEQRAQFSEDASKPEIGCSDVKLAYLAAIEDELFDSRGNVDWDQLKKTHPVLFAKPKWPKGDAGTGGGQTGTKAPSMNTFIRTAAGRRS